MWSVNCAENDVKLNIDVMDDYINAKGKQLEGTVNSEKPSYKCNMSIHTDRNLFVCFFAACTVTFY